jgi:hypothetical protein
MRVLQIQGAGVIAGPAALSPEIATFLMEMHKQLIISAAL